MPNNLLDLKNEELLAQSAILGLAIDVAFRQKVYLLLTDPNTDPELLVTYLKLNEKREEMKQKEMATQLKLQEVALKESVVERRVALDERKQTLNESKFLQKIEEAAESATKEEPAPVPAQPAPPAKAGDVAKQTEVRPVDLRAPVTTQKGNTAEAGFSEEISEMGSTRC